MIGFAEVLPLLVVALGLLAVLWMPARPGTLAAALVGVIDLIWCGVSLFAKQSSFIADAGISWQPALVWGTLVGALGPPLILALVPSRRWRAWSAWGIVALASVVLLADSVYTRWFGDMFPAIALLAAGQMSSVAGGAWNLVITLDAWHFVDVVMALPLMVAASRIPAPATSNHRIRLLAAGALVVLAVSGWQTSAVVRNNPTLFGQRFSNRSLVERTGPLVYHALDGWVLIRHTIARELLSDEAFAYVRQWFTERKPLRQGTGPWFDVASGMNLVFIQVESLQAPMVNMRVNGREVMPNLHRLQKASLSFSEVFDQTDEGRTSDAEWMTMTSLLPEAQGAAAFIDAGNHLAGLPSILAERGYQSMSAVAFAPPFWNRRVMHPAFGFSKSLFAADFGPGEHIGWGLNDRDFLLQMGPRFAALQKPFMAWLITQSLHYPFESFPDRHKELDVSTFKDKAFGNYVHGMHYFDAALGDFLAMLEQTGLRSHTVVVVTGDHSAGFPWEPEIAHAFGFPNEIMQWNLSERVPLVISVPGTDPAQIDTPMGQVDIVPTLLGLLGVDAAALPYVGRNMLGNPGSEPIVRRNGSWVDARHLFLLKSGQTGTHCYDRVTLKDVALSECAEGSAVASRATEVSLRVLQFDLQQRLRY